MGTEYGSVGSASVRVRTLHKCQQLRDVMTLAMLIFCQHDLPLERLMP